MFTLEAQETIQQLLGLFEHDPTREQIAQFLSRRIDPTGALAAVTVFKLERDGILNTELHTGFSHEVDMNITLSLADSNPVCDALRLNKTLFEDFDHSLAKYQDIPKHKALMDFKFGIAMPCDGKRVYSFLLTSDVSSFKQLSLYLESIRLAISLWERKCAPQESTISHNSRKRDSVLTPRQIDILKLIQHEKTNPEIANQLGYSESLIRQETIAIYRKLGVSGRRDLVGGDNQVYKDI